MLGLLVETIPSSPDDVVGQRPRGGLEQLRTSHDAALDPPQLWHVVGGVALHTGRHCLLFWMSNMCIHIHVHVFVVGWWVGAGLEWEIMYGGKGALIIN